MRRRATFRLIGSIVLVLAGVVGFPLLFDSQPRPVSVDVAIEIPDKSRMPPLVMPAPAPVAATAASAASGVAVESAVSPAAEKSLQKIAETPANSVQKATKNVAVEQRKAEPELKAGAKADDGAKALALLEGQATDKQAAPATGAGSRYVVQVGAFADASRVREVRGKLEAAGLKTYAQVVDTKDGRRTRVRLGPFADKAGAELAAAKVKALDLSAAVLTL